MSAFGGKADVIQGVAECPLLAISGRKDECQKSKIFQNRVYGKPPLKQLIRPQEYCGTGTGAKDVRKSVRFRIRDMSEGESTRGPAAGYGMDLAARVGGRRLLLHVIPVTSACN